MPETNLVRPSRDGDQFHYLWAARRCLRLLSLDSSLKAITIEGSSPLEADATDRLTSGEELIDVGEYYGSETLEQATLIRYIQLKHSTLRADESWNPSGLEKTLRGFAGRYKAFQQRFRADDLAGKLEFWFVSNRPISSDVLEAVHDAAAAAPARHADTLKKLERFTGLSGQSLSAFCKLLRLEGNHDDLWEQRNILAQDFGHYLPDADVDAPVQLKELVTRKALSESAGNPSITRIDVLRALKADERELFPAQCLIKALDSAVPREQEPKLLSAIVQADGQPVIVHAAGGVGKSVFATRIQLGLPAGSLAVLYDCFGNGQYRSASGYRHRHRDALVQIANELAARSVCHPLIPSQHAGPSAYMRAFLYRLRQSISSLRAENAQALLCIVIDAADNAQMAAEAIGEARSFVRDLIREQLPDGVRLVALCRSHRQALLDPPPNACRLELHPFSRAETALCLRKVFSKATERDIDEFHRLSSQNPRVQALALSRNTSLDDILWALGPNPTTVDDAIGSLLDEAIVKLRDTVGPIEKTQIDRICTGLAALRPLIPLSVLAAMSDVDEAAIKSFAFDLGRPLLITGDAVQFIDEPTETWFREKFKPAAGDLTRFLETLRPLAAKTAYVAAILPQLMLEAGQFAELVALALSSDALPTASPVEKRDVELQRLQFALKASLRAKRYTDAAKLALKAGGESAGDARQRRLLQANTDMAAVFMRSDRLEELVSRRTFGSGWRGSHHAFEAALLSGRRELLGEARSRLRMAEEWLRNWSQLSPETRKEEEVRDDDILEMSTASFSIHGPASCARYLRRWRPREVSFRVGRMLAGRFVDQGRYQDLDDLAEAADGDLSLVLAITLELRKVHRTPPASVVAGALRFASRITLDDASGLNNEGSAIQAVTALVEAAYIQSIGTREELISLLARHLPAQPPRHLASRFGALRFPLLRAYALRAALCGQTLDLSDLAHDDLRKELENANPHSDSQDAREFKENIGALLPWHLLWASIFVGRTPAADFESAVATAATASSKAERNRYSEASHTSDEIAQVWFDALMASARADATLVDAFDQWMAALKSPLFTPRLTHLARLTARSPAFSQRAFNYASKAFALTRDERSDAESKSESYVGLARAVLTASRSEAAAYFDQAVEVASKIGDENLDRWDALLDLSDRAASRGKPEPVVAYRLARCAELTYDYVVRDKHFDWNSTVEAIAGLCGRSSFAILSRWRDRNFGWDQRLLPAAVNFLIARGDLDPRVALALIPIRAEWNEPLLLRGALATCTTMHDKVAAAEFCYRYMTLEPRGGARWRDLKRVLADHNVEVAGLDGRIAFSDQEEQSCGARDDKNTLSLSSPQAVKHSHGWVEIFEGIDLCASNDISLAHRRFEDLDAPRYHEHFFQEACRRVTIGKEAEFIAAVASVADFDFYHLRRLLEQLPDAWKTRLAVKAALAETLKAFCQRHCMAVTKSRNYQILPLTRACELAGVSEADVIDVVLSAIGQATDVIGAGRLFTLVGLLATKLSKGEALEALSFGLDLFDAVLEDSDGDGPWSAKLTPPAEMEGSVAGYIWAGLAAPRASLRWEAAHVVRAVCELEQSPVLAHLIEFVNGASSSAFADARLHFYQLHARQWLLIGLGRAARDHPTIVARYVDSLVRLAFTGEPHVFIREFAKRAIQALLDHGALGSETDLKSRLATVNASPFSPVTSKRYQHVGSDKSEVEETTDSDGDRYYFGLDIGPYWLAPLGRCFGKSQASIEREALCIIRSDWSVPEGSRSDEDRRHRRKIYRGEDTAHSHGSYPRVDELRFYLSYHAMMVVAGKLLVTSPVRREPDDAEDEFRQWLRRHDLTRPDAGWLADRRDPAPLERPAWKDEKETDEWRWSVSRSDFDRVLTSTNGTLNLWGHWTWQSGHREETIHIRSALVSSDRSTALLAALQSASNPYDFRIPDAVDDLQIDVEGFQLKGWLIDRSHDSGLDEYDPWAGAIRYPPPMPARHIAEMMDLRSDPEHRRWHVEDNRNEVACSQAWGYFRERDDNQGVESGYRFQASRRFVVALLRKLKMDLIVEVEIERRHRYSRWESTLGGDSGFIPPNARLFLLRSDGSLNTL